MTCPHTSLVQSDTYPRGTRCSGCGQSVETLFADCRAQLIVAEASLVAAVKRALALEQAELGTARLLKENESLQQKVRELAETVARLAQTETYLRNEQHYHQQTKNELKGLKEKLEEIEAKLMLDKNALRLALEREKELQKKLAGSEAALSIQTDRVIEAENKDPVLHSSRDPFPYAKARK